MAKNRSFSKKNLKIVFENCHCSQKFRIFPPHFFLNCSKRYLPQFHTSVEYSLHTGFFQREQCRTFSKKIECEIVSIWVLFLESDNFWCLSFKNYEELKNIQLKKKIQFIQKIKEKLINKITSKLN